ncbi:MAG: ABC transporter permease [Armatimonadota bacterium]|nr:MAG: ABC transporter permease [Armatimonadota bacterium]
MTTGGRPPRIAAALLARVVPKEWTGDSLMADLEHEFRTRAAGGAVPARLWYWRVVSQLLAAYSRDRLRRRAERRAALRAQRSILPQQKREFHLDDVRQDLRFGLRQLWKRPGFSAIALAMLALGIGANTAIFSVVQTVLLEPLPFPEPGRLVRIWESRIERGWNRASVAPGNFWDLREMNRAFERVGAYRFSSANLTGIDYPRRLRAGRVTAGFFGQVLAVRPVLGRTFLAGEDQPGGQNRVLLLGNQFWRTQFGRDPAVLGTQLSLDGESFTVVGVLPPGRPWLDYADVYVPMVRDPGATRTSFEIAVVGRLLPGTTLEAGRADLERVAQSLEQAFPAELAGIGFTVGPSSEWVADPETSRALWLLLGAVGLLLMIACVNLANLFLAQATGRIRERAIRSAAGATTGRLIRQALTESLIISLVGAGLGLGLALWGVRALAAIAPGEVRLSEVGINGWILGFALVTGALTGVITGLVPALQASRGDTAAALRSGGQNIAGDRAQRRLRGGLVAAEVALSLILLVGAGLLVRSFGGLMTVERGFETENRLIASVNLPASYSASEATNLTRQLLERVSALAPVIRAAAVHIRPLAGGSTGLGFVRPDEPEPEGGVPWASWRLVTPGYLETLGVPILAGRDFREEDMAAGDGPRRILISQRIADLLWPGENPLGRSITLWAGQSDVPAEVLGVVGNMRERGIDAGPTLAVYLPYVSSGRWPPDIVIHTAGEPTAVVPAVRSILAELNPNIPLSDIATLEEMVGRSVGSQRFLTLLVSLFALLALLLALAGVYGVQSYMVARQTSEIGVRVALGATKLQIFRKVILQALRPALLGVAFGLGAANVVSRFMTSLLFEVRPTDPATYAGVAGVLAAATLLAAWLPAEKAAKVDPVIAFRAE